MQDKKLPFGFQKSAAFDRVLREGEGKSPVKVVAFYLPQFHPTKENSLHWGEGFTEWTNVARATAEFSNHHQPRAPRDFGYYDLRVGLVQQAQAHAAEKAGVSAFCYYYYWFDGERPLRLPIENHASDDAIELPFCLCFANENWTKKWDGLDSEIIFAQSYGENFAEKFWIDIVGFFKSDKYLKDEEGRPYLLVYRPSLIPSFDSVADEWQRLAIASGFPGVKLIASSAFENMESPTPGVNLLYEFPPLNSYALSEFGKNDPLDHVYGRHLDSVTNVHDYRQFIMGERMLLSSPSHILPGVMPDWDNVARRPGRGNAFLNSSPEIFQEWVAHAAKRAERSDEKILFVNAWNEWAEGAYLEPDQRYGWAYLNALSGGMDKLRNDAAGKMKPIALVIHAFYPDVFDEYVEIIRARIDFDFYLIVTTHDRSTVSAPALSRMRAFEVIEAPNKGRDIRPFIFALSQSKLDFDFGLKLHTKRSPHRVDGDVWRKLLVTDLIPEAGIESVVELFRRDPNIGFVAPDNHWVPIADYIGSNMDSMSAVCGRIGVDFDEKDLKFGRFIAGSMFWFRRDALSAFNNADLLENFVEEAGQLDGTPAHAIERLFSLIGEKRGYIAIEKKSIESLLSEIRSDSYSIGRRLKLFSERNLDFTAERIALSRVDDASSLSRKLHNPLSPTGNLVADDSVVRRIYRTILPVSLRIKIRKNLGLPV